MHHLAAAPQMNRALYDACDARSLRDEILDLQAQAGLVVIELLAHDTQASHEMRSCAPDGTEAVEGHGVRHGLGAVVVHGLDSYGWC